MCNAIGKWLELTYQRYGFYCFYYCDYYGWIFFENLYRNGWSSMLCYDQLLYYILCCYLGELRVVLPKGSVFSVSKMSTHRYTTSWEVANYSFPWTDNKNYLFKEFHCIILLFVTVRCWNARPNTLTPLKTLFIYGYRDILSHIQNEEKILLKITRCLVSKKQKANVIIIWLWLRVASNTDS